jgi:hypothetical protein
MPATAVTRPSVTARLYAGAVDAMPITMLESIPTAFCFNPLSTSMDAPAAVLTRGSSGSRPGNGTEGTVVDIITSLAAVGPALVQIGLTGKTSRP